MELIKQIQELGLTEIESKIYLAVLNLKETTVLEVARNTGIKRATVHFNIENLINKGLVNQIKINNKRMITPAELDSISTLLDKKKQEIEKIESGFEDLLLNLKKTYIESDNQTVDSNQGIISKYFEGKEAVKVIYDEAFSSSELKTIVNLNLIARIFPENFEKITESLKNGVLVKVQEIVEHSDISDEAVKTFSQLGDYEYRYLSNEIHFKNMDIMIYSGKVAIIDVSNQISGIVIEGKGFSNFALSLFALYWSMIK